MSIFRHGEGVENACLYCGRAFVDGEVVLPVTVINGEEDVAAEVHLFCIGLADPPQGVFIGRRLEPLQPVPAVPEINPKKKSGKKLKLKPPVT